MKQSESAVSPGNIEERRPLRRLAIVLIAASILPALLAAFAVFKMHHTYNCLLEQLPAPTIKECEAALGEPLAQTPLRPVIVERLAVGLEGAAETDRAINTIKAEFAAGADSVSLHRKLAKLYDSTGAYNDAANEYLIVLKSLPRNEYVLTSAISALVSANRQLEAVETAQNLVKHNPDLTNREWLAWAQQMAGNHVEAARLYGELATEDPSRVSLLSSRGSNLESAGQVDEALKVYDEAIRREKTADTINYRLSLNVKLGRTDDAIKDHEQLIALDPTATKKTEFARYLISSGAYDRAGNLLKEALQQDPRHYQATEQSVRLHIYAGDFAAAETMLAQFATLEDSKSDVIYWRAYLDDERGDERAAIAGYKAYLADRPWDTTVQGNIGHALIDLGVPQAALKWFDDALKNSPADAWLYDGRARAYNWIGSHEQAIRDANESIRLDPSRGGAYARRAYAYEETGKTDEALADYAAALERSPTVSWIREDYAALLERTGKAQDAERIRTEAKSP